MSQSLGNRHVVGVGAAACAVCCAPLVLPLLGLAGVAATVGTFLFAGAAFAGVVAAAALLALWKRRRTSTVACRATSPGPVSVDIGVHPGPAGRRHVMDDGRAVPDGLGDDERE